MIIADAKEIEERMQEFYSRLPEKNRRLYADIEALQVEETLDQNRSRHNGGSRKATLDKQPGINEVFLLLLKEHTAGNSMDETQK
jgi:hypothetical protein